MQARQTLCGGSAGCRVPHAAYVDPADIDGFVSAVIACLTVLVYEQQLQGDANLCHQSSTYGVFGAAKVYNSGVLHPVLPCAVLCCAVLCRAELGDQPLAVSAAVSRRPAAAAGAADGGTDAADD
jgi:hypothetical protein